MTIQNRVSGHFPSRLCRQRRPDGVNPQRSILIQEDWSSGSILHPKSLHDLLYQQPPDG